MAQSNTILKTENFRKNLTRYMKMKNRSHNWVAQRVRLKTGRRVSYVAIFYIITGRNNPRLQLVIEICEALNLNIIEMLSDDGPISLFRKRKKDEDLLQDTQPKASESV